MGPTPLRPLFQIRNISKMRRPRLDWEIGRHRQSGNLRPLNSEENGPALTEQQFAGGICPGLRPQVRIHPNFFKGLQNRLRANYAPTYIYKANQVVIFSPVSSKEVSYFSDRCAHIAELCQHLAHRAFVQHDTKRRSSSSRKSTRRQRTTP
jgi:hypothetical protein